MNKRILSVLVTVVAIIGASRTVLAQDPGTATIGKEFSFSDLVEVKHGFRHTASKISLTKAEINTILWQGYFMFFDVKAITPMIKKILGNFPIVKITLAGKGAPDLLTVELEKAVEVNDFTNLPLLAAQKVAVSDFGFAKDGRRVVGLKGFTYQKTAVHSFVWNEKINDGASLILVTGEVVPFNIDSIKEMYKKNEELFEKTEEKNNLSTRKQHEIAESIFKGLYVLKKTSADNLLHIPMGDGHVYSKSLNAWLEHITKDKRHLQAFVKSIKEIRLDPKEITLKFAANTSIAMEGNELFFDEVVTLNMGNPEAIMVSGVTGENVNTSREFTVTNAKIVAPTEAHPHGALRLMVQTGGGTKVGRHIDFKAPANLKP
jgi:hypothetical protein